MLTKIILKMETLVEHKNLMYILDFFICHNLIKINLNLLTKTLSDNYEFKVFLLCKRFSLFGFMFIPSVP